MECPWTTFLCIQANERSVPYIASVACYVGTWDVAIVLTHLKMHDLHVLYGGNFLWSANFCGFPWSTNSHKNFQPQKFLPTKVYDVCVHTSTVLAHGAMCGVLHNRYSKWISSVATLAQIFAPKNNLLYSTMYTAVAFLSWP